MTYQHETNEQKPGTDHGEKLAWDCAGKVMPFGLTDV